MKRNRLSICLFAVKVKNHRFQKSLIVFFIKTGYFWKLTIFLKVAKQTQYFLKIIQCSVTYK